MCNQCTKPANDYVCDKCGEVIDARGAEWNTRLYCQSCKCVTMHTRRPGGNIVIPSHMRAVK